MALNINIGALGTGSNHGSIPTNAGRTGRLNSIGIKSNALNSTRTSSTAPIVKADQRLAKIRESMQSAKAVATSAAHAGAVARPMEKNISKSLEQRRAQAQGRGTSVARLGTETTIGTQNTTNLNKAATTTANTNSSTSVARLGRSLPSDLYSEL